MHGGNVQERWGETLDKGLEWQDKGNGFKLIEGRFTLDVRKKLFPEALAHLNMSGIG